MFIIRTVASSLLDMDTVWTPQNRFGSDSGSKRKDMPCSKAPDILMVADCQLGLPPSALDGIA